MSILFTLVKSHPTALSTLVLFSVWSTPHDWNSALSAAQLSWNGASRSEVCPHVTPASASPALPSSVCWGNPVLCLLQETSISVLTTCLVCTKQNEITLIRALYWGWIILISQSEHDDGKQLFNFFISVVYGTALNSSKLSTGHCWQSRLSTEAISMSWKSVLKIASRHLEIRFQDLSA